MAKKKQSITKEEINSKLSAWDAEVDELVANGNTKRNSPQRTFLTEIKDKIEDSIKKDISIRQISITINKVFGLKISESTIKAFCINENILVVDKETKKPVKSNKALSVEEMKKEQSTSANKEDRF